MLVKVSTNNKRCVIEVGSDNIPGWNALIHFIKSRRHQVYFVTHIRVNVNIQLQYAFSRIKYLFSRLEVILIISISFVCTQCKYLRCLCFI